MIINPKKSLPLILYASSFVKPGNRVLDLGAGQGKRAELFYKKGAKVTAVDKKIPPAVNKNINWVKNDIIAYVRALKPDANFDIIFMQNVIQFLNKEIVLKELIPDLCGHLAPNGIIAIRTFWKQPKPAFDKPIPSLFSLFELRACFGRHRQTRNDSNAWKILWDGQYEKTGPDLKSRRRKFYLTDLVVKK